MQMQIFDTMTEEYLQATQHWFAAVESAGMHLMVILLVIQFTLKISKHIISGEGHALGMMTQTLKHLILLSVLYYLMTHAGTLLPELFNSFKALGVAGSSITTLDPSSVVSEGLAIASAIIQGFDAYGVLTDIAFALFGFFCCITIVICYGLIAADLMITLIESYFLVAVSSLFIAFGSTSYTLPMAREYLGMTLGVGIKLMMLYVMIAIGVQLGNDWAQLISQAVAAKDWTTYLGVAVGSIIYYLIVKSVPGRIASAASQAFAISHISDVTGTVFSGIANTATAGSLALGSLALAKSSFSTTGTGAQWLHGQLSSFLGNGQEGSDTSMNNMPNGEGSSKLASQMLMHFGDHHDSSIHSTRPLDTSSSSISASNLSRGARQSSSLVTPAVIHLPGPEATKGQSDLFVTN